MNFNEYAFTHLRFPKHCKIMKCNGNKFHRFIFFPTQLFSIYNYHNLTLFHVNQLKRKENLT